MTILVNLLQYTPGYSGFSSYIRRVVPGVPGVRLFLSANNSPSRICTRSDSCFPEKLPDKTIIKVFHRLGAASLFLSASGDIQDLINSSDRKYSLIYSPLSYSISNSCGLPEVLTCHDLIPLFFPGSLKSRIKFRAFVDSGLRKATKIIAISQFCADQLIDKGHDHKKIEIVKNGIIIERSRVEAPVTQDIVVLSRHDANKNIRLALLSVSKITQKFPEWPGKLIVVGRKGRSSIDMLRCIQELCLHERVCFLESVSQNDLVRLVRHSLCLVSPSFMEGFNYPVLEAMAEGIPCLISDIPVHRELYSGAALFFDPHHGSEKISNHVISFCRGSKAWSDLSVAGYHLAQKLLLSEQIESITSILDQARSLA